MNSPTTAPAAMPVEEERAFNLAARAMQRRFGASGTEEDIEAALSEFFAPILAEKEREIERHQSARAVYFDFAAKAEARALAAEAALAGERERVKELRGIILDALYDMDISGLSVCGAVKAEMRYELGPMDGDKNAPEYTYDAALATLIDIDEIHGKPSALRKIQQERSAAIRAQGE